MSTISPDELIEEVRPWDTSSWRTFVEDNVVPIHTLAKAVERWFRGDISSEVLHFL